MSTDNELSIRLLAGGSNEDQAAARLALRDALVAHQEQVSDLARLITRPMTPPEVLDQVELAAYIAAYVAVSFNDILSFDKEAFKLFLAERLSSCAVENVAYEGVWTLGDTVVMYVKGDPVLPL